MLTVMNLIAGKKREKRMIINEAWPSTTLFTKKGNKLRSQAVRQSFLVVRKWSIDITITRQFVRFPAMRCFVKSWEWMWKLTIEWLQQIREVTDGISDVMKRVTIRSIINNRWSLRIYSTTSRQEMLVGCCYIGLPQNLIWSVWKWKIRRPQI